MKIVLSDREMWLLIWLLRQSRKTIVFCRFIADLLKMLDFLPKKFNASYSDTLSQINPSADIYIFSVKDDALGQVLAEMPITKGFWIHTAGSVSINIFRHLSRSVWRIISVADIQ